jgi:soluble lytic murein transglycosylase-like protein
MTKSLNSILPSFLLSVFGFVFFFEVSLLKNNPASFPAPQASTVHRAERAAVEKVVSAETGAVLKISEVHALIKNAAKKHGVSPVLVKSIIATESNFQSDAISPRGAIGLMQMMPATAQDLGADPSIPEQNVDAGTRYLRFLIDKYKKTRNPLKNAIAAYNAGFGAVDRYRGVPPFKETRDYVTRVLSFMRQFQNDPG